MRLQSRQGALEWVCLQSVGIGKSIAQNGADDAQMPHRRLHKIAEDAGTNREDWLVDGTPNRIDVR